MKKKGNFLNILLVLVFFVGLSLLLYPSVSDYWNSFHQTRAIAAYAGEVAALDDGIYDELLEAARDYNQRLAQREEPLNQSEEDLADMLGFLKQHLSDAQIAKINGEPALLEQELVTYFFGDSYEHIAFRAARDLFA